MPTPVRPRRYAFVGTGHRAEMYIAALVGEYAADGEPVALCDPNPARMDYYQGLISEKGSGLGVLPTYGPDQLAVLLEKEQPDAVVVASKDSTHADVVTTILEAGRDVVCEKPLTIAAEGCARIAKAAAASAGHLTVTFNYRYSPRNTLVRELIAQGVIGDVTSVAFEWMLDTVHGADYFRRWHRRKEDSGGLLVHKSTHHFDLVNWWLQDVPQSVYALGTRRFYGPGGSGTGQRCETGEDPFALDLGDDPRLAALYGDARVHDGYIRNQDVFAAGVDIEDNLAALVRYRSGSHLSYTLNAHAPWEGYRVAVNGTEGRLELEVVERAAVTRTSQQSVLGGRPALDPSVRPDTSESAGPRNPGARLLLQRHWEAATEVELPESDRPHGGGDDLLLHDVFRGTAADPWGRRADFRDGIRSVLVGVAANRSLVTGAVEPLAGLGVPEDAWAT